MTEARIGPPRTISGPKLSSEAMAAIQRIIDWEDNSWRNVMGREPRGRSDELAPRSEADPTGSK
jgi:hypothetical protein